MKLTQTIKQLVSERTPFRDRIEPIVASADGVTVRCDVETAESLGCKFSQIDLVEENRPKLSMEEVVQWSEWICGRVNYLLEPLSMVELDSAHGIALIRSREPHAKDGQVQYYELTADRNHHASLRRYQCPKVQGSRRPVAFPLTHDQLEVLIDDLIESASVGDPKRAS